MSTYLYCVCLDHVPPLRAEEESGQHLYDLPRIRGWIARRNTFTDRDADWHYDTSEYFRANTARFLRQHQQCRIGIVDETGRQHPLDPDDPSAVSAEPPT